MTQKITINIFSNTVYKTEPKFSYKTNYEQDSEKRKLQQSPSNPK